MFKFIIKLFLNLIHYFKVIIFNYFNFSLKIPSLNLMRKTSSTSIKHYLESAFLTSLPIIYEIKKLPIKVKDVLDFGCGVGRQAQLMSMLVPNLNLTCIDVDISCINYLKKNFTKFNSAISGFSPPLNYKNDSFDLIYSISTFSHFTKKDAVIWIREFFRILKPNGYLIISYESYSAIQFIHKKFNLSKEDLENKLNKEKYIYIDDKNTYLNSNKNFGDSSMKLFNGIDGDYGFTLYDNLYIAEIFENFEVCRNLNGIIDNRQNLIILKKQ